MNSHTVGSFWKLFYALPQDVQEQAYRAFRRFQRNPFHPRVNFEEVNSRTGLWSARITDDYRVLGYRNRRGGDIRWFWIGTHTEYEKLIRRR